MRTIIETSQTIVQVIASKLGRVATDADMKIEADESFLTATSVLYDAVYVPGGVNALAALALRQMLSIF